MKTLTMIMAVLFCAATATAGPIEYHARRAINLQARAEKLAVRAGRHRGTAAAYSTRVFVSLPAPVSIESYSVWGSGYYVVP